MNREIKFRSWGKLEEAMYTNVQDTNFDSFLHGDPYEIMQYVGLKDKNGRDIYEGDIFQDEEDGSYDYVMWNAWYGGWGTNQWFTPEEFVRESNTLEVIGNIYENPNLL